MSVIKTDFTKSRELAAVLGGVAQECSDVVSRLDAQGTCFATWAPNRDVAQERLNEIRTEISRIGTNLDSIAGNLVTSVKKIEDTQNKLIQKAKELMN